MLILLNKKKTGPITRHAWPFTILSWQAASNTKRKYQAIRVNYNSYRRQNIGQNTHFNKMSNKKHNQKTYKMAASYKPNHADFPLLLNSTVSKPVSYVSSLLSFTSASRSFSNKVKDISLSLLLKTVINLFLGSLAFVLETLH